MRRGQKRVFHMRQKCRSQNSHGFASKSSFLFLDAAIASLQESMSARWLVGHWLVGRWLVGPLVPLSCWGYRSDEANLGWFDSLLPLQCLCINTLPDANGD